MQRRGDQSGTVVADRRGDDPRARRLDPTHNLNGTERQNLIYFLRSL
jgi:hypothetical protein